MGLDKLMNDNLLMLLNRMFGDASYGISKAIKAINAGCHRGYWIRDRSLQYTVGDSMLG